jgi:hypothetical protein
MRAMRPSFTPLNSGPTPPTGTRVALRTRLLDAIVTIRHTVDEPPHQAPLHGTWIRPS